MSLPKSIRTVVEHFATEHDSFMNDEEKLKNIRLNVNFITAYPEFFDNVMLGPTQIFYGRVVVAKSMTLKTEYQFSIDDEGTKSDIGKFTLTEAFEELATYWRHQIALQNTIIPYVPLYATRAVDRDTFFPKLILKSRFGLIEAVEPTVEFNP